MATELNVRSLEIYDADFYVWALEQAGILRARRFDALDLDNLIEEIESLAGARLSTVLNAARVVMEHLLKLQHSPTADPGNLWRASVREQRRRLQLDLTARIEQLLAQELPRLYDMARDDAAAGMRDHGEDAAAAALPAACPYSVDQELVSLGGAIRVGLDVLGGIAGLAEAMLAAAGLALVHVPGLAVNRARQGAVGGENKSDPRDARTIADQVRTRSDLRPIDPATELDLEIRLLVGRRRDLVDAQTQRLSRMHDLLVGIFPGLEACLDLKTKGPLVLLTKFVTPAELRTAGNKRLVRHLRAAGGLPHVDALAERALAAAVEQTIAVPAERMSARLIKELAQEALAARARLAEIDRELEEFLDRHPDAALIRSLPGMGAVLTAELIAEAGSLSRFRSADALAAAAGIAPVLR